MLRRRVMTNPRFRSETRRVIEEACHPLVFVDQDELGLREAVTVLQLESALYSKLRRDAVVQSCLALYSRDECNQN